MRRVRRLGSARDGIREWHPQRTTAVALIALGLYFVASMVRLASASQATAAQWLSSPVPALPTILFLAAPFAHAFVGLRSVLLDYVHARTRLVAAELFVHGAAIVLAAAVMLSFGDPSPFTGRIRDAGCKIICQVQRLALAKEAAAAGADVIIAQGRDAGAHSGTTRGTLGPVPAVEDAVGPLPVAAGGIADGRGLAAALALGAAGVSMGTRFIASRESLWDLAMKAATLAAGSDQTEQTRVFNVVRSAPWPAIYPGRALRNAFSARWNGREDEPAADQQAQEKAWLATALDDFSSRVVWAGEGVDLIDDIPSAAEIIERIVAQAAETLVRGARLVHGTVSRSV